VVYVDFWASWCKPCKQSFPFLNDLQQRYRKNGLVVLAINLDKDPEQARQFLQHIPARFTVAFDQQGVTAQSFHVQGMPSSYLIDRKGNIRARHIGFREEDKDKLEQAVASLLKE
jgi:thiol-disulfide isomerase/thioredoxin